MADETDLMEWKHKGAYSELIACTWLLRQGYEVFRNVSPLGLIDIVAIKGDVILKVDVKSANASRQNPLTDKQRAAGVVALLVYVDGNCEFWKEPPVPRYKEEYEKKLIKQRATEIIMVADNPVALDEDPIIVT
jgi:predicted phosphodiesterase